MTHWWRGTVVEITGDDVACELVDDRGTRSSALLPCEEFQSVDNSYPVRGQRFILAFQSCHAHGFAERKQSLIIDPPPRIPAVTDSELQEEVRRIFGGRDNKDSL